MNVLSLFDGMSCGQQALERIGIKVDNYFASEIDKYAITVTMANYPNTKQLGSVINVNGYDLPKIDLLIGGSPCQSFSFAGKRKGMSTKDEQEILTLEHYLQLKSEGFEFEGQSYLFWEYMRLLNEVKPKYFLLENVMMGEKWEKILSKAIGVNPIMINSSLVSAQNRQRLYWTNIGLAPAGFFGDLESIIQQPKNKNILLKDILQDNPCAKTYLSEKEINVVLEKKHQQDEVNFIDGKARTLVAGSHGNAKHYTKTIIPIDDKYFLSDKTVATITRHKNKIITEKENPKQSCTIHANYFKMGGRDQQYIVHNMMPRSGNPKKGGTGHLTRTDRKTYCLDTGNTNAVEIKAGDYRNDEGFRWRENGKTPTLMARAREDKYGVPMINTPKIRRLTPTECERLQTVKDGYTNYVSDSQRYKMLGNGWTVDVIAHIFNYLKQ
jgi:DNA (cytosine-5)-methyltransferase 3A